MGVIVPGGPRPDETPDFVAKKDQIKLLFREGKILMNFGATVPHFITHVIFARNDFVAAHPDQVKKFLDGWFRSVAYMKTHRAQTITIAAKYEEVSEASIAPFLSAMRCSG